jgi:hypothetical protein
MGEGIDQVKVEYFVELAGVLEDQGFFIQVGKNRQELIFFHILFVRAGVVNNCRIDKKIPSGIHAIVHDDSIHHYL